MSSDALGFLLHAMINRYLNKGFRRASQWKASDTIRKQRECNRNWKWSLSTRVQDGFLTEGISRSVLAWLDWLHSDSFRKRYQRRGPSSCSEDSNDGFRISSSVQCAANGTCILKHQRRVVRNTHRRRFLVDGLTFYRTWYPLVARKLASAVLSRNSVLSRKFCSTDFQLGSRSDSWIMRKGCMKTIAIFTGQGTFAQSKASGFRACERLCLTVVSTAQILGSAINSWWGWVCWSEFC